MISRWLAGHVRFVLTAFVALTVAGLVAALNLPVSLFPHIDFARVRVDVDAGDRATDQMVAQVTRPLEAALRQVPGVSSIRSTTSRGTVEISLTFPWGENMVEHLLQTQAAMNAALPSLPSGLTFDAIRLDPTVFPILGFALSSPARDQTSLRAYAELQLRPVIAATPGVAAVEVLGGSPVEYQVVINPARAQALGLSLDDISKAVAAGNQIVAVGRMQDRHRLYLIVVESRLSTVADLGKLGIKTGNAQGAGVVTLGDVAQVRLAPQLTWTRVTAQGRNAVLINVRQTPDANSVAVAKAVRARIAALHAPHDINVATYYDQTELVTGAAGGVRDAILLGALLAGAVLFAFLRSVRLMGITALMLPAVLLAASLALYGLGMSFNMMTLGGLAAAVGLVVDDVVVMLEHAMRRLEADPGAETRAGLLAASGEMARPLIGSSLSTIVVFVPLAFISGVTGGFFKALAVTMTAALAASLVFTLFVVPLLARWWVRNRDVEQARSARGLMDLIGGRYRWAVERVLARPGIAVAAIAAALLIIGGLAFTHLGSGFMPIMDEGGFVLDYKAHPGAALDETDRLLRQVEDIIRATPDVDSYSRRTGQQLGGGLTEADEGDFFIHLKRGQRRPVAEVMSELRQKVQAEVPGLDIETAQLMEDLIGDLTAVPQPIEIKLFGTDPKALETAAKQVAPAIGKVRGVVEVIDGLRVAGDSLVVRVDRGAAALEGLDPDAVAKQVSALMGEDASTQVQFGEQLINVRVMAPQDLRARVEAVAALRLHASDGHDLPLSRIAAVTIEPGQRQITREDLQPFVDVTGRLEGRDLGSAMKDVRAEIARTALPPGVRVEYGGLYAQQQASFADLAVVFIAALLLVTLLLLYLFERWAAAVSVLAVALLSSTAVFIGLFVTGTELNISALMGLTMVVGIVGELAIFYLAELATEHSTDAAALTEAGLARLRPILMSAVIAILALTPLAFGLGEGAALEKPLAIAIIAGLIAGAPLVLLVLPAIYALLGRLQRA